MTDEERNEQNEDRDDEERSDDEERDTESKGDDDTESKSDDDTESKSDDDSESKSEDQTSGSADDDSDDDDDSDKDDSDDDSSSGKTTVGDVMSEDPQSVEPGDSIEDAAKKMKEGDTGALLVVDGDDLKGIITDRDIVVNAIAEGNTDASVEDVCSTDTTTIEPDASLGDAIDLMRENKIRRLPVVGEDGDPVGIVSLGDLAIEADDDSALKEISAAKPNA
jgi:CBS domain-containing protein